MNTDVERVMTQCSRELFTGRLEVRTLEGRAEVRFLSGIQDEIRFDSLEGDAALQRLLGARAVHVEAIAALPPLELGSQEPVPLEGTLDHLNAARLMRFCEANSLTCELDIEVNELEPRRLTARYRLGELLSVEPDSEYSARLADARRGRYCFRLPRIALPAMTADTMPELVRDVIAVQGPITVKSKVASHPPQQRTPVSVADDTDAKLLASIHLPRISDAARPPLAPSHYWLVSIVLLLATAGLGWIALGH